MSFNKHTLHFCLTSILLWSYHSLSSVPQKRTFGNGLSCFFTGWMPISLPCNYGCDLTSENLNPSLSDFVFQIVAFGCRFVTTPQPFYGPFSGTTQVSRCQKTTSGLYGAGGRLTEADTLTIWLGATPSELTSAHLHHPPIFLQAGCPSCHPTNSVKALKATSAFQLGRRC